MRRVLRLALLLLLLAPSASAEEKVIEARILSVMKDEQGCFQDLGYSIQGAGEQTKAWEERLRTEFPKANSVTHKDNFKKKKFLGSHVVVLRTKSAVPRGAGCSGIGYGIGFGTDEAAAKKDAKSNLSMRWIDFDEKTHGLDVLLSEKP